MHSFLVAGVAHSAQYGTLAQHTDLGGAQVVRRSDACARPLQEAQRSKQTRLGKGQGTERKLPADGLFLLRGLCSGFLPPSDSHVIFGSFRREERESSS